MSKKRITDLVKFKKEDSEEAEMSFFDHLEVLRWHLIRSAIAIVVFTTLAFVFYDFIFNTILMGPAHVDFWTYRMLCLVGEKLNMGADLCVKKIPIDMINTTIAGQFMFNMNSGLMIGVVAGIPYLLYELWSFIKPGLRDIERKSATGFVFYASLLFMLGVLFGYFIVTPLSINFLSNFTLGPGIQNLIPMDEYLSFMGTLTIGTGITFELPILVFILSKMGIVTPKFMRSIRRYASVSILIIAAVVTPGGDILTMLTVSFPLFLLYEVSIIVSDRVDKKRKKAEADFYSGA